MHLPSTDWKERIDVSEAAIFEGYAKRFAAIQARRNERWGKGRALHRKQLLAAQGTLEVLDSLPSWAAHGLFAHAGQHEVWMRLSNGGMDRASDRTPDIRGMALRVFGVSGESALGGSARSQDFTLINQDTFGVANSRDFVDLVEAASKGGGAVLRHVFTRYGVFGGPRMLARLARTAGRRFSGFATETLSTVLPMANGPFAVRARLVPGGANGDANPGAAQDWGADFAARLRAGALHWDLQLQYFTSELLTPIEDPMVDWPTPWTTVARLMLPQQDVQSTSGRAFAEQLEGSVIDPWQALAAHRPLGELQRARKVIYYQSQKGRGAA